MSEVILALIENKVVVVLLLILLALIPIEVASKIIKTKNPRNPLFWLDLVMTTTVSVFYKRLRGLLKRLRSLLR